MNFTLVAVVLLLSGGSDQQSAMYDTLAECEKDMPNVVANVAEYNASAAPDKVVRFAVSCLALGKAPQGKGI